MEYRIWFCVYYFEIVMGKYLNYDKYMSIIIELIYFVLFVRNIVRS